MERGKNEGGVIEIADTESLVPADHQFRQIDGAAEYEKLYEELPHFSTVSYNFRHRFTAEAIEAVFRWILEEAGSAGALTPAAVFIDGTHIKASANLKGRHQRQFAREAHTACDKNGYVLETAVTPGNVHDSVAFDGVYDKVTESFPQIQTIAPHDRCAPVPKTA